MGLHTLAVTPSGDIEIPPRLVTGVEAIRNAAVQNLRFSKGEWFLNLNEGLPYFESIFVKGVPVTSILSILRQAVLNVPGAVRVNFQNVNFDVKTRELKISNILIFTEIQPNRPIEIKELII